MTATAFQETGRLAGQSIGGWLGGAAGELIGPEGIPLGVMAGRYLGGVAGAAAGDWLFSKMVTANSQAGTQAGAQSQAGLCQGCSPNPKCKDLKDEIHEKMYGQKGDGSDNKGLFQRQQEQINGQYGPGQVRMGSKVQNGTTVFRNTVPWDTHSDEIQKLQNNIKELLQKYKDEKCYGDPNAKLNQDDLNRALDKNFNPSPDSWKGS